MFKSLYSGVSGLAANLTNLDVIGNNIANSNTVGFKSGRVTFNEMLTQTIKSASRPVSGGLGGSNPQQVGLGTKVGSIDTNFNQGNFQTTGKKTDLAIQGNGFFVLSDGASRVYTRAGIFGLDSENILVNPSTGLRAQGWMADSAGILETGPMTDIFIDPSLVVPAQPSTTVQLMGNLDSSSDAKSTIRETPSLLVSADGSDLLTTLNSADSGEMGVRVDDVIQINGQIAGAAIDPTDAYTFTVAADSTLDDLAAWLNSSFAALGHGGVNFAVDASGALAVTNSDALIQGLSLAIPSNTELQDTFSFTGDIPADGTTYLSSEARAYADAGDLLTDLYTANNESLGLTPPTSLLLAGTVGTDVLDGRTLDIDATTTVADLMQELQYTLGINSNPIEINASGQIVVQGEVGLDSALAKISITEDGLINNQVTDALTFVETQQAADQKTFSMATTIYDSLGTEHTVNFTFEKVPGLNEWIWTADTEGNETILSGGTGRLRFSDSGAISNFSFDDGSDALTLQPMPNGIEGAANIVLDIDYGEIGALTGLTQFEGTGTLQSIADGYGTGTLVDFNIDQSGVITGIFSNDTMQAIAQIGLAQFSNPDGLMREANNTYRRSGNSGQAFETAAGVGNGVSLVPGALETSNVDLAAEFTNLVVAQRAFQANSRVITTADQVMQELVNLVR